MTAELRVLDLGPVPLPVALATQDRVHAERVRGEVPDTLLLAEHPLLLARGRRTPDRALPMGEEWYRAQGLDLVDVDRGGGLVPHGPGQLVGYVVMAVDDVRAFGCRTEDALATAARAHGVAAEGRGREGPRAAGVWVGYRQLAFLGLRMSRGVSRFGFALNVRNDLQPFHYVAAGRTDGDPVEATSLARELRDTGAPMPEVTTVAPDVARAFADAHGRVLAAG